MHGPPADWLTRHVHELPAQGLALDLACGRGRHALWLASLGLSVVAVDRDPTALVALRQEAGRLDVKVDTVERDLEADLDTLGHNLFDVVVCVHYLHRPLFPAIVEALRPSGVLIYETFTRDQGVIGRPRNPAYLLAAGELPMLVEPLKVVAAREGLFGEAHLSSIVARKEA